MLTLFPVENYYNVSEIVLSYKTKFRASDRPQITDIEDAYKIFLRAWDDNKLDFVEEAKLMLLNRAHRVLGICTLSSGGITGTVMDTRHVFAAALKANACNIILAHNHPSDNLEPSNADRTLTEKMKAAGELVDINALDHVIIGRSGCYSLTGEEKIIAPQPKIIPVPA